MKDFFDQRQDLSLTASEKEAFLEFISGRETGRAFRQHLEFMSQKETLKSSAAQISLLKHLSSDILPLTLSKSTGENYGRVLEEVTVGPYHGVNSPSFTEFGSQWEAMIYHFQTALARGVTSKQVQDVYDVFFKSAGVSADLQGIAFEDGQEKEKDSLSVFRSMSGLTTEKEHLDDYEPLVELGITQVELEEETRAVRQILLHHIEAVRKLRTHKINIPSIMKLPAGDLIKVLENVDSLIITLQKGVTLPTVLKIITGSKKAKAVAA